MAIIKRHLKLLKYAKFVCAYCGSYKVLSQAHEPCAQCGATLTTAIAQENLPDAVRRPFAQDRRQQGPV